MIRHLYAADCELDSAAYMIPVHDEHEFDSYNNDVNLDRNWLDAFFDYTNEEEEKQHNEQLTLMIYFVWEQNDTLQHAQNYQQMPELQQAPVDKVNALYS